MNDKFIYVFSESDKDIMINNGFKMLYENKQSSVYVFLNDMSLNFASTGIKTRAFSDVLAFN